MDLFEKMRKSGVPEWGIVTFIIAVGFILGIIGHALFG